MKRTILGILFFVLSGCTISNSTTNNVTNDGVCPEEPQSFPDSSSVQEISLEQGSVSQSGQLNIGQQKVYTFKGEPGDKLSYRTEDEICVWVYTPDNNLMNSNELKLEGNYTLQVAALKGSTSFELEMSFGELTASTATSGGDKSSGSSNEQIPSPAPVPAPAPEPDPPATPTPSTTKTPTQSPTNTSDFSQADAVKLVQRWLDAKSKIFSPPFDRSLAQEITTGLLYTDITKPDGSIDWLRNNNSYYIYNKSSIQNVSNFSNSDGRPSLRVSIFEDRTLIGKNGKRDASQSGSSTNSFTYFFAKDNGVWKIVDYRE